MIDINQDDISPGELDAFHREASMDAVQVMLFLVIALMITATLIYATNFALEAAGVRDDPIEKALASCKS